ncbi:carboxylate-amine ligase [Actinacidiphila alni]|uniref:Putative glutamate--cysteine ligase 2 n=1 Tax=Actinacidiphila alni TaxID=380248 RepID=A0A1I2LGS9_9ACTN|nr:glutamate--cysteine ligase [Actinacidiphila alni]SFF76667.1 carboxylate-amine ligase [Actinacidiphila alni]
MTDSPLTLGIEEEYLLLDAGTGLPSPRATQVQAMAHLGAEVGVTEVENELLQAQVEVATGICTELGDAAEQLAHFRTAVGDAAARAGCRLAATGAAPFSSGTTIPVTDKQRYHEMRENAAVLVDEQLIDGMHIHVAVPDRHAGAAALGRLRPWLSVMVALGGNSPYWEGRDTGFASWRTVVFGRWPVSGAPPYTGDAATYEQRVDALLRTGVIPDRRQLYWHARLSETYPTLEVRAADVQLDVDSAITLAGLARALVATGLRQTIDGAPPLDPPSSVLHAAGWHAARHGLTGNLVDPLSGSPARAADVVAALLDHVTPALREYGDEQRVHDGLVRLLDANTGAERQRRAREEGGTAALLDLIAPTATAPPPTAAPAGDDEAGRVPA